MFGLFGTIIGIILLVVGGYLVVFFPATIEHQTESVSIVGIVFGIVLLIAGGILIFVP